MHATLNELIRVLKKIVLGHDEPIETLVTALLSGGHVLLEGLLGLAKRCWRDLPQN